METWNSDSKFLHVHVTPMSELWGFVYIKSHVTLQAKADTQKVSYICLLHSFVLDLLHLLTYEILYFLHSYVIRSVPQELYIFHGRLKLSWFFKPGMFSVKIKTTSINEQFENWHNNMLTRILSIIWFNGGLNYLIWNTITYCIITK